MANEIIGFGLSGYSKNYCVFELTYQTKNSAAEVRVNHSIIITITDLAD